ncbi:hypothetical protein EZI54_07085 [Marinobacter halodurans]|uniref:Uncharacterized protein n=1 Tax=Marinobacter halodurans TaxID=2528979 RepID=A0ABY1ZM88_9GAMM|nr:hypothetical protein [Marinobacter halodurans]TBW57415.1 hypothetical protein EZI54_07085 [Marinobacter halodurans]
MKRNKSETGSSFPFGGERVVIWFDNPNVDPVGLSESAFPYPNKVIDRAYLPGTDRLISVVLLPLTEAEIQEIRKAAVGQGSTAWIREGENYVSRWKSGHYQH